jgi:hypothetical protein
MFERRSADPEPPALDADYLARLRSLLGDAVLDELLQDGLLQDGLIELADRLVRLAEMRAADDREGLAELGHDLVGMAGHLGLSALSAAAAAMNRAARGASADASALAAMEAHRIGRAAELALRHHLGKDAID